MTDDCEPVNDLIRTLHDVEADPIGQDIEALACVYVTESGQFGAEEFGPGPTYFAALHYLLRGHAHDLDERIRHGQEAPEEMAEAAMDAFTSDPGRGFQ